VVPSTRANNTISNSFTIETNNSSKELLSNSSHQSMFPMKQVERYLLMRESSSTWINLQLKKKKFKGRKMNNSIPTEDPLLIENTTN
jgi:hypothetical protein